MRVVLCFNFPTTDLGVTMMQMHHLCRENLTINQVLEVVNAETMRVSFDCGRDLLLVGNEVTRSEINDIMFVCRLICQSHERNDVCGGGGNRTLVTRKI